MPWLKSDWPARALLFLLMTLSFVAVVMFSLALTDDVLARSTVIGLVLIGAIGCLLLLLKVSITKNRIRYAITLGAISIAALIVGITSAYVDIINLAISLINDWFAAQWPLLPARATPWTTLDSLTLCLFFLAVVALVLRSFEKPSAAGIPDGSLRKILPEITDIDKIQIIRDTLRTRIDRLDHETNWSATQYVPLQAEVQVLEGRGTARRIVDLMKALQKDQRSRIFVVLGEPGSGKSVAMRKLARDLFADRRTERIPVYINLKEWRPDRRWTPDAPPTDEELYTFVKTNILQSLSFTSQQFLMAIQGEGSEDNFRRLYDAGFFFFIFDSFDEIAAVLDHDDSSWLIKVLSACVETFITGTKYGRGVVASRLFRKPRIVHHERSVLELRPFSDDRVVRAIRLAAMRPDELAEIVMARRPDLGTLARNPFLLQLIIGHWNTKFAAPQSQAEIFQTFIDSNLDLARKSVAYKGIDDAGLYDACERIAKLMFETPEVGLEISDADLGTALGDAELRRVLLFLRQARIARMNEQTGAVTFVHRRFNEYFLARRLTRGEEAIPYDAIQTDSRWRDTLVLYAEVAPEEVASNLVAHAWDYTKQLATASLVTDRDGFLQGRNALRFLVEAFRGRPALLTAYHGELESLLTEKIAANIDLIEKRTVLEAVGLLPIERSHDIISDALTKLPRWVSESAITAARYLGTVQETLLLSIYNHILSEPMTGFVPRTHGIEETLRLCAPLAPIAQWLKINRWQDYQLIVVLVISFCFSAFHDVEVLFQILVSFAGIVVGMLPLDLFLPPWASSGGRPEKLMMRARVIDVVRFAYCWGLGAAIFHSLFEISSGGNLFLVQQDGVALVYVLLLLGGIHLNSVVRIKLCRMKMERICKRIGEVIAPLGIVITAMIIREELRIFVTKYQFIFVLVLFVICVIILVLICSDAWRIARDILDLLGGMEVFVPDRVLIASRFGAFRTSLGRAWYVRWLRKVSGKHLEAMRNPANVWPPGGRPQLWFDPASVELARLDAWWQGLD